MVRLISFTMDPLINKSLELPKHVFEALPIEVQLFIHHLIAQNKALKAENIALRAEVQRLTARVQELENKLNKNSSNSSNPLAQIVKSLIKPHPCVANLERSQEGNQVILVGLWSK